MTNLVVETHKSSKRKRVLLGLLIVFFVMISSILLFLYPFASKEKVNYFTGEHPILFNGKQEGNALFLENEIYIPVEFLKEQIDEHIFYDVPSKSMIITSKTKVIYMPTDSLTYYVNEEPIQLNMPILIDQNGEFYLALDLILPYYDILYSILPKTNAIEIVTNGMEKQHGTIQVQDVHEERLRLRTEPSLQSPYTAQIKDQEKVTIEKREGDYVFIRKNDGTAGYISNKYVTVGDTEIIQINKKQEEVIIPQMEGPIQLTWEAVYTNNPDTNQISEMPGVNVVSPTWFELSGSDGSVKNLGSLDYVNWAKKRDYQIWGLFSNAFDPDTHQALKKYETRQSLVRQCSNIVKSIDLDGINIDIENVREEDGPLVTQFVREATPYFHQAGLMVSMDITFMTTGNWSAFYEREKLAESVDYLIVMAYDEHWGSSKIAGSVASFPWVEANLQKLLEVIPNDKLILGIPLYTRLWEEKSKGVLSSKAMSMAEVKEWLAANAVTPQYDEVSGQNYAEYYAADSKSTYRIWLEDEFSLQKSGTCIKIQFKRYCQLVTLFCRQTAWTALSLNNRQVTQKD